MRKGRGTEEVDMRTMLRSIVDTRKSLTGKNKASLDPSEIQTSTLTLQDLYGLIEQHKLYLVFLEDNGMYDENEIEILYGILSIFLPSSSYYKE